MKPYGQLPPYERRYNTGTVAVVASVSVVATLALVLAVFVVVRAVAAAPDRNATWVTPSSAASVARCTYEPTPGDDRVDIPVPTYDPDIDGRNMAATMRTNRGDIVIDLHGTDAPCAVASFRHLATIGFYQGSSCHRLTIASLSILQCGDPVGDGTGGPGYQFADENLPSPNANPPYTRGMVAMANRGPNTNGSQFFVLYRDAPTDQPRDSSVLGTVRQGLEIIDAVAAGGVVEQNGPGDGRPILPVTIESVTVRPA